MGAWVGSGTFAARGVPRRFLDPSKPKEDAAEVVAVGLRSLATAGKKRRLLQPK